MVNFPNTIDNNDTLYLAVNNRRTRLTAPIDDVTLTIPVVTTSGYPSTGFVTILSDPNDITKAEAIKYTSINSTNFFASQRGSSNTTARTHKFGDFVDLTVVEEHHNALKDAVIAVENYLGTTGNEHFLRVTPQGNVAISGTLSVQANTVLSGSLDVAQNLTVTGTAIFGPSVVATGTLAPPLFASNDVEQSTTSTTFTDSSCTTAALKSGVEYLIMYGCNFGGSSNTANTEVQVLFGSTKIALAAAARARYAGAAATVFNTHYGSGALNGFYKVTGDGVSTLKIQYRTASGGNTAYIGAQSLLALPLTDRFTETVEYFIDTQNSDTPVITNASTFVWEDVLSTNFSLDAGDYLVLMSVESQIQNSATIRSGRARFFINGTQYGPDYLPSPGRTAGGDSDQGMLIAHLVNIPSTGVVNFLIQGRSTNAPFADYRRPRVFVIKASVFKGLVHTTDSTGLSTSSTTYQPLTGLNSTIVPVAVNAPIISMVTSQSYTTNSGSAALSSLRNHTDLVDYRVDSGRRDSESSGSNPTDYGNSSRLPPLFMFHYETRNAITEYRAELRSSNGDSVRMGINASGTAGTMSEMVLWEYSLADEPNIPFDNTTIDDELLTSHAITADQINAKQQLTVSGSSVLLNIPNDLSPNNVAVSGSLTVSGATVITRIPIDPAIVTGSPDLTVTSGTNRIVIRDNNRALTGNGILSVASGTNTISISVPPTTALAAGTNIAVVSGSNTNTISTTSVVNFTTVTGTTVTGTTAAFGGFVSGQTVSGVSVVALTNMTVSGTPVMHTGVGGITVSGSNLTKGQINLVGSRGGNVSIAGNTITFDANPAGTGGGSSSTTVNGINGPVTITGAGNIFVTTTGTQITVSGSGDNYVHIQSTPSATWTISHPLNTIDLVCQTYDTGNAKIESDTETALTTSSYQITFNTALAGRAVLLKGATASGTPVGALNAQQGDFSLHLAVSGVPVVTGTLTVRETDGAPWVNGVHTIIVTTGTLTNVGNGVVSISTGGGAGGGGGMTQLSDDPFPTLGGNLDGAGFNISNVGILSASSGTITNLGGTNATFLGDLIGQHSIATTGTLTAATGTFTQGITVGGSTTYIYPDEIRTPIVTATSGIFNTLSSTGGSLTVSTGTLTNLGGTNATFTGAVQGTTVTGTTINAAGTISASAGDFSNVLTFSGSPVMYRPLVRTNMTRQKIINTAVQTVIFSETIPANSLRNDVTARVRMHGEYFNNSAATRTYNLNITFGGITLYGDSSIAQNVQATVHRAWYLEFEIGAVTAEAVASGTEVRMGGFNWLSSQASATDSAGLGTLGVISVLNTPIVSSGIVNLSQDQLLEVRYTHSTANANLYFDRTFSKLEVF